MTDRSGPAAEQIPTHHQYEGVKALELSLPPSLVAGADEVIE
jgi:hypothetical protein